VVVVVVYSTRLWDGLLLGHFLVTILPYSIQILSSTNRPVCDSFPPAFVFVSLIRFICEKYPFQTCFRIFTLLYFPFDTLTTQTFQLTTDFVYIHIYMYSALFYLKCHWTFYCLLTFRASYCQGVHKTPLDSNRLEEPTFLPNANTLLPILPHHTQ